MHRILFWLILLFLVGKPVVGQEPLHRHPTLQAMLEENNRIRESEGLRAQPISPILTKAAQDQALYMARTHDFEHVTIDNGSPGVRAARYGYSGTVRENLGRAQNSISRVFTKWMASTDGHRESIISDFKEVGFGYAIAEDGTKYWVALYGTPRGNQWEHVLTHQEPTSPSSPGSNSPSSKESTPSFLLISSSMSNQ